MKFYSTIACLIISIPILLLSEDQRVDVANRKISSVQEQGQVQSFGYHNLPPVYFSKSHHWLTSITLLDDGNYLLEIEDGSQWKISSFDRSIALSWKSTDPICITQNDRWFSSGPYQLINQATKNSIEATLHMGPLYNGEFSRFIVDINKQNNEICLNDHTRWDVSFMDHFSFKDWEVGDYVIIGKNSDYIFWAPIFDQILINVNLNNFIRVKEF